MSSEGLGDRVHKVVYWSSPPQEWQRYSSWFTKGLVNMIILIRLSVILNWLKKFKSIAERIRRIK